MPTDEYDHTNVPDLSEAEAESSGNVGENTGIFRIHVEKSSKTGEKIDREKLRLRNLIEEAQSRLESMEANKARVAELNEEMESLINQRKEYTGEIKQREETIIKAQARIESLEAELTRYGDGLKSVSSELEGSTSRYEQEQERVTRAENQAYEKLDARCEQEIAEVVKKIKGKYATKKEEIKTKGAQRRNAIATKAEEERSRLEKDLTNIKKRAEEVGGQLGTEKETYQQTETERDEYLSKLAELDERRRDIESKLAGIEQDTESKSTDTFLSNTTGPGLELGKAQGEYEGGEALDQLPDLDAPEGGDVSTKFDDHLRAQMSVDPEGDNEFADDEEIEYLPEVAEPSPEAMDMASRIFSGDFDEPEDAEEQEEEIPEDEIDNILENLNEMSSEEREQESSDGDVSKEDIRDIDYAISQLPDGDLDKAAAEEAIEAASRSGQGLMVSGSLEGNLKRYWKMDTGKFRIARITYMKLDSENKEKGAVEYVDTSIFLNILSSNAARMLAEAKQENDNGLEDSIMTQEEISSIIEKSEDFKSAWERVIDLTEEVLNTYNPTMNQVVAEYVENAGNVEETQMTYVNLDRNLVMEPYLRKVLKQDILPAILDDEQLDEMFTDSLPEGRVAPAIRDSINISALVESIEKAKAGITDENAEAHLEQVKLSAEAVDYILMQKEYPVTEGTQA